MTAYTPHTADRAFILHQVLNAPAQWQALPDYNIDNPADPFRPFGKTPGHAFEWARRQTCGACHVMLNGSITQSPFQNERKPMDTA